MLALPNRNALLELFDHVARRLERAAAMRMADGDRNTALADCERAEPMLYRDVARVSQGRGLFQNRGELTFCHRPIGSVLDTGDVASLVQVAHHPEEEHGSAVRAPAHPVEDRGHIDWPIDDRGIHRHPPATGGIRATSSPGRSSR